MANTAVLEQWGDGVRNGFRRFLAEPHHDEAGYVYLLCHWCDRNLSPAKIPHEIRTLRWEEWKHVFMLEELERIVHTTQAWRTRGLVQLIDEIWFDWDATLIALIKKLLYDGAYILTNESSRFFGRIMRLLESDYYCHHFSSPAYKNPLLEIFRPHWPRLIRMGLDLTGGDTEDTNVFVAHHHRGLHAIAMAIDWGANPHRMIMARDGTMLTARQLLERRIEYGDDNEEHRDCFDIMMQRMLEKAEKAWTAYDALVRDIDYYYRQHGQRAHVEVIEAERLRVMRAAHRDPEAFARGVPPTLEQLL